MATEVRICQKGEWKIPNLSLLSPVKVRLSATNPLVPIPAIKTGKLFMEQNYRKIMLLTLTGAHWYTLDACINEGYQEWFGATYI